MAPEASEEQGIKEVEMVPAAPNPVPEQQQERDVTAHQDYSEKEQQPEEEGDVTAHQDSEKAAAAAAAEFEKLLSKLQAFRARISQLLAPVGRRIVVTAGEEVRRRRCLAFMETELSIAAAFLTTLSPQHYLEEDGETKKWLLKSLDNCDLFFREDHEYFCREVDPTLHTLLRKAAQCFCRSNSQGYSSSEIVRAVQHVYGHNEHPCRYRRILITGSEPGLTPQLPGVEAGSLPPVGIDRPAKKILRWLSDRRQLSVMSIVGPVGIGKTTLAMELRNRVRRETSGGRYYFQCNVMAQASRGTDTNILLQHILSQVSEAWSSNPSSQAKTTTEVLIRLVSECLRDKRYFVIIDDIWEASDWGRIKAAFPNNNHGSRILITTRSTSTAWACCSDSYDGGLVHEIKPLSKDSERMLLAKAVGSVDGCLPHNMNKLLCEEILRRCDGIPLCIIGTADWLKGQRLEKQYPRVDEDEEHQRFAMHYEEQVPRLPERLEQALSSALIDFPNHSRLLYMSMFPYGYKFEKDRLILKWLHEHLIHDYGRLYLELRDAKSEAETFFSQLEDRNVITCVASNCKHNNNIDEAEDCRWQVNHFLQQFLASKSAEMGYIFTTATLNLLAAASTATGRGNEISNTMPRRLALHHPDPQLPSLLKSMDLSQTRLLFVSGTVSGIPLDKFVNLVVLDLEGWENLKDEDLLHVCRSKMFFLKYLSVRNTRVHKLPHEIKELQILRTLDVSYTQITELPLEVYEMSRLLHLDLRGTRITQLPNQIVGLRGALTGLLVGGEGTTNSVETATRLPHDVRHFEWLKTLATVDLTEHPASFVRALGDLEDLEVLAVTWSFHQSTDNDFCQALLSSIGKWKLLKSLTIHCGLGCSMEFLDSIENEESAVLRMLEKFKVTAGRFASVPRWIDGLEHLAFVQITICNKQATDDLKILGGLPILRCLILGLDFIPGQAILIENEGFNKLQCFSVDCTMPWLTFSTGTMPKLTYLQLKFCSTPPRQTRVPWGISNLCRLREVALCYNAQYVNSPSVKMTVEAVTQQVAEHCNPIDLFINGIEQVDVQESDDEVTEITVGTSSRSNAGAEDDAQPVGEDATSTAAVRCEITEAES